MLGFVAGIWGIRAISPILGGLIVEAIRNLRGAPQDEAVAVLVALGYSQDELAEGLGVLKIKIRSMVRRGRQSFAGLGIDRYAKAGVKSKKFGLKLDFLAENHEKNMIYSSLPGEILIDSERVVEIMLWEEFEGQHYERWVEGAAEVLWRGGTNRRASAFSLEASLRALKYSDHLNPSEWKEDDLMRFFLDLFIG